MIIKDFGKMTITKNNKGNLDFELTDSVSSNEGGPLKTSGEFIEEFLLHALSELKKQREYYAPIDKTKNDISF